MQEVRSVKRLGYWIEERILMDLFEAIGDYREEENEQTVDELEVALENLRRAMREDQ